VQPSKFAKGRNCRATPLPAAGGTFFATAVSVVGATPAQSLAVQPAEAEGRATPGVPPSLFAAAARGPPGPNGEPGKAPQAPAAEQGFLRRCVTPGPACMCGTL